MTTFEPLSGPVSPADYPAGPQGRAGLPSPLAAPTPAGAELVHAFTIDTTSADEAVALIDRWLVTQDLPIGRWVPREFAHHVRTADGVDLLVIDYMHPGIYPDKYTVHLNHEAGRCTEDDPGAYGLAIDRHVIALPDTLPAWLIPAV